MDNVGNLIIATAFWQSATFWIGVFGSIVAATAVGIALFFFRNFILPGSEGLVALFRLFGRLKDVRMIRFNRSRDDYKNTRADGIANYISSAKNRVIVVGVNLITGVEYEELGRSIQKLAERDVQLTISLLDPKNDLTMTTIAQAMGKETEELSTVIQESFRSLLKTKEGLDEATAKRVELRAHSTVPFGSAILVDPDSKSGEIQIETKPYKSGLNKSFGFALQNGGAHDLYTTLLDSYRQLIVDGRPIEVIGDLH